MHFLVEKWFKLEVSESEVLAHAMVNFLELFAPNAYLVLFWIWHENTIVNVVK